MNKQGQRGQVLVLFVGGLVTLLLIGALVIDLGFAWMIQRHEQNATDPGALAAARYIHPVGGGPADPAAMWQAACFYARQNGFFSSAVDNSSTASGCVPANDASSSTLIVNYPPSQNAGQFAGDPTKVEVVITQPHKTFLAQFAGQLVITVAASAVASYDTGDSGSSSLVALDPHGCKAGQISGGSSVIIEPVTPGTNGGYIQINSDCTGGGSATDDACKNDGNGAFAVEGGAVAKAPHLYVRGSCTENGGSQFIGTGTNPTVTETALFVGDPLSGLRPPPVSAAGAYCNYNADGTPAAGATQTGPTGNGAKGCTYKGNGTTYDLFPGTYYGGWTIQQKPLVKLHPGIYVIAGGGITMNAQTGSLFESVSGPSGTPDDARVLIYSTRNPTSGCGANYCVQGDITFSANSALDLKGLNSSPCPPISSTGCPYAGLLLWQDAAGAKDINISAGSSLSIAGTIYDPTGLVNLDGSSSTSGCTTGAATQNCASVQIIAWEFNIDGGAGLVMPYDPNDLYHLQQKGLVK
jgi:Putative Flp pilus-assembly TadE/G-like